MDNKHLNAIFISEENAIDFPVNSVINIILENVKLSDIEEMYILDSDTENYFLVSDLNDYNTLTDIVQPSFNKDGSVSLYDFDIQLKNGVSIYTHDNLTIEAPDKEQLFKYIDFIFRAFKLDAVKCKEKLENTPNEPVDFKIN